MKHEARAPVVTVPGPLCASEAQGTSAHRLPAASYWRVAFHGPLMSSLRE